ncbi:alpha/beta hydrolase [Nocardioides marmorisolisilvae]|uniref:Alpha/beta hydrolase n=2 Tax=Nocardioides marmorisolisilvae TaxID=1542737 RepID=A0A3N0E0X3_9ACTN|nr:alpha/beta hydrolase [Nocardioides marmorisolisilvae]
MTPPGPPLEPPPPGSDLPPLPSAEPRRAPRNAALVGLLVGVLVFAVAAAGFASWKLVDNSDPKAAPSPSPAITPTPSEPMPSTPTSLDRFYGQKLDWRKCGRDFCTHLEVPLDYANPSGKTLELAVLKVPAQSQRIGSLVVNPGGPGGSGISYAAAGSLQFGSVLSDHFDIVGFDPRGVGLSDPLKCLGTQGLDRVLAYDPDPDTPAEVAGMDQLMTEFGQSCLDNSGDLAKHVSTKEAAKDMDVLRAALGEAKLDYLGASYGTFLGATYAEEFPTHVGRFVLDGAVDPALSNTELSKQQGQGFETALRAYLKDCVDSGDCFLGRTVDQGLARIKKLLDDADAKPLSTGTDRPLTEGLALTGIFLPLYVKSFWPQLTSALKDAIEGHDGKALLDLSDQYASRGPNGYTDNAMDVLYAVNCLDHDDYVESKDVPKLIPSFEKAAPTFGRAFAYSTSSCSKWPIKSGERTTAIHAKGAPTIVVVGTTRDPATPLAWAQALAKELDSGTLITRDGDGHTGFQQGNTCVNEAVEAWLVSGTKPKPDLHC